MISVPARDLGAGTNSSAQPRRISSNEAVGGAFAVNRVRWVTYRLVYDPDMDALSYSALRAMLARAMDRVCDTSFLSAWEQIQCDAVVIRAPIQLPSHIVREMDPEQPVILGDRWMRVQIDREAADALRNS